MLKRRRKKLLLSIKKVMTLKKKYVRRSEPER